MSFLRSPSQSPAAAAVLPQYTGLQLNTATNTLPIPICYGMAPLSVNVIFYQGFTAIPVFSAQQSAGKGGVFGGGGGGATVYQIVGWYYTANLALALCEGPISGINQVWQGQSTWLYSPSSPNPNGWSGLGYWTQQSSLFVGNASQSPWSLLTGIPGGIGYGAGGPGYALNYSSTAYLGCGGFNLGGSASIGTLRFEVCGVLYGTGWNGIDADPALVIEDFLTSTQYGAGFPSARLDLTALLGSSGDSSTQMYCKALGLAFSPQISQYETAASILTRWLQILNVGAVRSGPWLRFIPYGDMNLQGNGVSWTAPVTPVYALNDNNFVAHDGEDPVLIARADPMSLSNVVRVEALNRVGVDVGQALAAAEITANLAEMQTIATRGLSPGGGSYPEPQGQPQYEATPIEARDLSQVSALGGIRIGQTITMHEVCDLGIAAVSAQILLQRGLYIRNTYKFSLSWEFCLLDPMDVVTITDYNLGLVNKTVRITEIEEDDNGELHITAEDLTIGVSTPAPNIASGAATTYNSAIGEDPVESFLIWEPPALLVGSTAQIWFGAIGGAAGVADPNWGGAFVWASIDGTTYSQIAKIVAPLQSGVLTANYPSGSGFDTTDTLSLDVTQSGAVLISTTDANAQIGAANLCVIGSEIIAFATATLTGVNTYNLTRVQRGMYGTTPAAHPSGAALSMLQNVAKIGLPAQYVGVPLYIKFQSFNIYGGGVEDLSTCAVENYTPSGAAYASATLSQTLTASGSTLLTTTAEIPQGTYLLSVQVTVMSVVTGPTSFNIDPEYLASGAAGGTGGAFGSCGVALGSTQTYSTGGVPWSVASPIRLTPVGGSFTGGSIKVVVTYLTVI